MGERLSGLRGPVRLASRALRAEPEPVYNIEVDGEHCYRVGQQGLLVHNASAPCPCTLPDFPDSQQSPFKEYQDVDGMARPQGVKARLNKYSIGCGTRAILNPPGWDDRVNQTYNNIISRGHLLANILGGSGTDVRNVVTVCQRTTNSQMEAIEIKIWNKILELDGASVDYEVEALYNGTDKIPYAIRLRATSIEGPKSPNCWVDFLFVFWDNPIGNSTNPYKCKGGQS